MNIVHNPDGTVTVTTPGDARMSELRETAALAFAADRGTAVEWPALVGTTELDGDRYAATYTLSAILGKAA